MITIDCTIGEGSPVRVAVGLSAARDRPVHLKNIFAGRETPGLTQYQAASVRAVAELTNAETEGLEQGSTELVFRPDGFRSRTLTADIPDDGSTALTLQPLMIAATASTKPVTVRVEGGSTAGPAAPTIHYVRNVTLPLLEQYGYEGSITVERHGFAPHGGAVVEATFDGAEMDWIDCRERGEVETVRGVSWASDDLSFDSAAERQRMAARKTVRETLPEVVDIELETVYEETDGTGCAIQLWADAPGIGIGGSAFGEDDGAAEATGSAAGEAMGYALMAGSPLDEYLSDQIVPFLGLTGGNVRVRDFTDRVVSNIAVTRPFSPYTVDMKPDENGITVS